MPITVLSDVILPNSVISSGVRGKNMRMNQRSENQAGYGTVNIIWSKTLRQYELGIVPMLPSQWQDLEALHEVTEAGAYGFLLEDPKDNSVTNGPLTLVSTGIYQLQKRYTNAISSRHKDRTITRPQAGGFSLSNSGVTISSALYTLDATTGRVTIPGGPSDPSTLAWSGRFYVPVHFAEDLIDWELVRSGPSEQRLLAGPSVTLQEVRE